MFELAANRRTARDPADLEAACEQKLAYVVGGRLTFDGEVGCNYHFFDDAIIGAPHQTIEVDFPRPDAIQRGEPSH